MLDNKYRSSYKNGKYQRGNIANYKQLLFNSNNINNNSNEVLNKDMTPKSSENFNNRVLNQDLNSVDKGITPEQGKKDLNQLKKSIDYINSSIAKSYDKSLEKTPVY